MIIFFLIDAIFSRSNENTNKLREIPDKGFNDNFFFLIDAVFSRSNENTKNLREIPDKGCNDNFFFH
jgi:hypothetical protein